MKKLFFALITLSIVLITGAGCNYSTSSSLAEERQEVAPVKTSPPGSDNSTKVTKVVNAYHATTTKLFSDSEADFTFEYPSTWTYKKFSSDYTRQQNPESKLWSFIYQGKEMLLLGAPPYETALDLCSGKNQRGEKPIQLDVFSTNDPSTSVVAEVCGEVAYIYWIPGRRLHVASDLSKINIDEIVAKYHSIVLYSEDFVNRTYAATSTQPQNYLDWVKRIAKSIKIVKK